MVTPNDMLEEITLMVDNSRKDWEKVIGIVKACQEKGMSPEETGEQIMRGMFPCHYTTIVRWALASGETCSVRWTDTI